MFLNSNTPEELAEALRENKKKLATLREQKMKRQEEIDKETDEARVFRLAAKKERDALRARMLKEQEVIRQEMRLKGITPEDEKKRPNKRKKTSSTVPYIDLNDAEKEEKRQKENTVQNNYTDTFKPVAMTQLEAFIKFQRSPIMMIEHFWGLTPQPVLPEYSAFVEEAIINNRYYEIKAEHFGDYTPNRNITWQQYLILRAVELAIQGKAKKRITVRSGHGIGKSTTMAWLVIWYLLFYAHSQIPCTAPTGDQLFDVLWKEIAKWLGRLPDYKWLKNKLEWQSSYIRNTESPSTWFARAKTARKESPEALAGIHGDYVMMLVDEACFDEKTEILTSDGFKFFKNLTERDKVLSMDEKNIAVFEKPLNILWYEGERDMYYFRKRGCDFAVTSNHKMLYSNRKIKKNRLKEIKELDTSGNVFFPRKVKFVQEKSEIFTVKSFRTRNKLYESLTFKMTDWVELVAWYLSEGCILKDRNVINITQCSEYNTENFERIKTLLKRMGLEYKIYGKDFRLKAQQVSEELKKYGDSFESKFVPDYIKKSEHADLFLNVFALGDGYHRKDRRIFYSSSKRMIDDIQEMLYLSGSAGSLSERVLEERKWYKDHYIQQKNTAYVVIERQPTKIKYTKAGLEIKKHIGTVYCVTTKYGNVFIRRNGKCMWSGNSGVPDEIFTVAEGALTEINTLLIMISNPTRLEGYFYDSHHSDQDNWQCLAFSCIDSPRVDSEYVARISDKHGIDSDEYKIRVLGEFPRADAVDDKGYVPLLTKDEIKYQEEDTPFVGSRRMGIDPSGEGNDTTRWVIRDKFQAKIVGKEKISNPKSIAQKTLTLMLQHGVKARDVWVDNFGVGAEVTKELALAGENCNGINVGDKAKDSDTYINKRAEIYIRSKKWVQSGGKFQNDKEFEELTLIRFRRGLSGRVQIKSKQDMKKDGVKSPNCADAFSLTFCEDDFDEMISRKKVKKQFKPNYNKVSYNRK